jgi:hypothetical protein
MPKDEWRRAHNQSIARRAKLQRASGTPLQYEFLGDEITPLNKINVFDRAAREGDPDPTPPNPPRAELAPGPNPIKARPKGSAMSVRFALARGVSVFVKVDGKAKMNVLQALESALAEARTRSDLMPRTNEARARPEKAEQKNEPKPIRNVTGNEPEIAVLRKKLKNLAETIVANRLVKASWRAKRFVPWVRQLSDARTPSIFAQQLLELESNATDTGRFFGQSRERLLAWKQCCSVASTVRELSILVVQLEDWFKRSSEETVSAQSKQSLGYGSTRGSSLPPSPSFGPGK